MSEQFATKHLMERHENVVQGATDRRERREVTSSFDKPQSEEELKRADPQLVTRADPLRVKKGGTAGEKRADPQRERTSQTERDDEHSTAPARRCSGDRSPNPRGLLTTHWRTRSRIPSCGTRKARTRRTENCEGANDPIHVADSSNQDEVEDAKEDCRGSTDARH